MSATLQISKLVVLTDWFNERDEYVGVLSAHARAAKLEHITNTCQYCLRTGLLLHAEKVGTSFNMHCQDCLEYLDLMQHELYEEDEDEHAYTDLDDGDAYDDFEPEEHECMCCGSISYTSSHDGYCGACRSYEKRDA